jgi:phosphinothricin acetyltransferase
MSVTVRAATVSDAEAVAAIYAPAVLDTVISFELEAPTTEMMAQRIASALPTHPWLVAARAGVVVGYAYATQHMERAAYRWSVDVAAYLAEDARRQGIGRMLYERLIEILKTQGFHVAYGGVALPNPASVALHEAVGFEFLCVYKDVGFKMGRWVDVGWWQLRLSEPEAAPQEPIPFAEIAGRLG